MTAERVVRDPGQAHLAICLSVKDQNKDLREWIKYHHHIGVGKFYVFDDNSSVPTIEGLQDLVQEGELAAIPYTFNTMLLQPMLGACSRTTWMPPVRAASIASAA